jgi:hypothetical protein
MMMKMSKVVKSIYLEMKGYGKLTEVSDFLACGLVGVKVKDKPELTEEELKELNQNKDE